MPTMKIYVSGWYEYSIDNPAALVDASQFTPEEFGLDNVPSAVWQDICKALLTEVTKSRAMNPPPEPPGATMVDSKVRWGLTPPRGSAE